MYILIIVDTLQIHLLKKKEDCLMKIFRHYFFL